MRKNSSRTGSPVTSVRPLRKEGGRLRERRPARARPSGAIERLVNPGTAFGSITTTGIAAQDGGQHRRSGDVAAHAEDGGGRADTAVASRPWRRADGPARRSVWRKPTRFSPPIWIFCKLEPRGRDQLGFQPCSVPTKQTWWPRARSSRATARPGITCPPVPPPAIRKLRSFMKVREAYSTQRRRDARKRREHRKRSGLLCAFSASLRLCVESHTHPACSLTFISIPRLASVLTRQLPP